MFIISETRSKSPLFVVARPGYAARRDGSGYYKDGSTGGPEWGEPSKLSPYLFKSHRAAERVRGLCGASAVILDARTAGYEPAATK